MADLDYNLLGANKPQGEVISLAWLNRSVDIRKLTATERSLWIVGGINMIYVVLQLIVAAQTGSLAMVNY